MKFKFLFLVALCLTLVCCQEKKSEINPLLKKSLTDYSKLSAAYALPCDTAMFARVDMMDDYRFQILGFVCPQPIQGGERIVLRQPNGYRLTELANGSSGNSLTTNASGNVQWKTLTTTDISEGLNQYFTQSRFDVAFSGKSTTNLPEGTNQYFTNTRARNSFSFTTTGTATPSYNSSTGVLNIPTSFSINNTTVGLTSAQLNTQYSSEKPGHRVICGSIALGGAIYTKYSENGSSDVWLISSTPVVM